MLLCLIELSICLFQLMLKLANLLLVLLLHVDVIYFEQAVETDDFSCVFTILEDGNVPLDHI